MSVTPRDARSAEFAGASLSGPGPLAEGLMAFTTPVPLPSPAQLPTPQHSHMQAPARADKLHQGPSSVRGANIPQISSGTHSQSSSRLVFQHRDNSPAQTGACSILLEKQIGGSSAPSASAQARHNSKTPQVGTSPYRTPRQGEGNSAQPPVHTCGMPDAEDLASPGQGTKEGIAEVLTGHLHAWGKTLQKLRRPGRGVPEEGLYEPDMQPLGRPFIGQTIETDLARYIPHLTSTCILKPSHEYSIASAVDGEAQAQPRFAHDTEIPAPQEQMWCTISALAGCI